MKIGQLLSFFWLVGLSACSTQTPAPGAEGRQEEPAVAPGGAFFRFSTQAAALDPRAADNWCNGAFDEGIPVNAESANANRRYFSVQQGVYMITVRLGTTVSSWMLRPAGNGAVEIFTSVNYPLCLSKQSSFHLRSGGSGLDFDNERFLNYGVDLQPAGPQHQRITLEFPPDAGYGFTVRRCAGCR